MNRRLAAILAADVVGYSAMMADDEAGTIDSLRRLRRELFQPAVAGHRGKVVKSLGDGWLVEFSSAVDAVSCALQVQTGLDSDPKIKVRIGIHIGDITHEDEDIYGDGVNVAARLEAAAEPGAILVSDAVFGSLDGTLKPLFDDYGLQPLKNLPRPVQTWARRIASLDESTQSKQRVFKQRLAVVPVTTSDRRPEVKELAAALTNDFMLYLAGPRWLEVAITERRAHQSYSLSAHLRTRSDRLRLEISLSGPDGKNLWGDKIDGLLEEDFDWQDDTATKISSSVVAIIEDLEKNRLDALPEDEQTAETWMLRALLDVMVERAGCYRIVAACKEVIARDPGWGRPYSYGLIVYSTMAMNGWRDERDDLICDPDHWFERAIALSGPDDPSGMVNLAFLQHRRSPDLAMFRHRINNVLRHEPTNHTALILSSIVFAFEGEPALGLEFGQRAVRYSGQSKVGAGSYGSMAAASIQLDQYEIAAEYGARAIEVNPNASISLWCGAAAFAASGRQEQAQETIAKLMKIAPSISIRGLSKNFANTSGIRQFLDCLRFAGMPEGDE